MHAPASRSAAPRSTDEGSRSLHSLHGSSGRRLTARQPTMPDVARLAGVSIKTVSRVVNDEPNVSASTTERVLAAIAELGYRRNDLARNLRAGLSSATIGLIIEDLRNPFY